MTTPSSLHYIFSPGKFFQRKGGAVGYINVLLNLFYKYNINFTTKKGIGCRFVSNEEDGKVNNELGIKELSLINLNEITSFHCHNTSDFFRVYSTLNNFGIAKQTIKILTTHNPYKPSIEQSEIAFRKGLKLRDTYEYLENFAFKNADALIFPASESLDGYYSTWPDFRDIAKSKILKFCPTGLDLDESKFHRKDFRQLLGINSKQIVIIYIGRTSYARGSDFFLENVKHILELDSRIILITIGLTCDFVHHRIISIKQSNSICDYLNIADIALVTNRASLFDLTMVEFVNSRLPIVCPNVGGYRFLEGKYSKVYYYSPCNLESICKTIKLAICCLNTNLINSLDLSGKTFLQNYCSIIDEIYDELDFRRDSKKKIICPKSLISSSEFLEVKTKAILSPFRRKIRKLTKNPKLYFKDFYIKHFTKHKQN